MLRYKVIKNQLVTEIAGMNVNDRLPSRLELCKRLDTTRMTIDKAIKELVTEGVLFSKQGDGTFVAAAKEEEFIHKGNWGVIVPDVSEGFFAKIVRGVENVAQKYGVNVVLCNTDYDFAKQEQYIKRLDYSGISGLIVVPIVSRDIQENYNLYNQLNELNIPFVFCNSNAEGVNAPVVTSNNFYGGYIATKHLLEKGYRNIAYISKEKLRENVERCQGYITALSENGIEVNHNTIIFENKSQVQCPGYESMKKLITFDKKVWMRCFVIVIKQFQVFIRRFSKLD
jgi:ABC-type sugar transport system substrate-binding protein